MLSISASFFLWVVIALVGGIVAWQQGSRQAASGSLRTMLGAAMAISYLAASWFLIEVAGEPIKVASATAVVALVIYCCHSGKQIISSWGLLDALIGGLMLWHVVVDSYFQGFSIGFVARAYGEWVLPYAAGRFAVMHRQAIAKLSPWFVAAAVVIGLASIFETFTRVNLWESLFHPVDDLVRRSRSVRYGWLYRAIGPTRHPIFLAVVMMTLIPWAFALWESARSDLWRRWGAIVGGIGIGAGILASGSRAPFIALAAACCFAISLHSKIARWIFIAVIAVGGILVATQPDRVADLLDSNMREVERGTIVVVEGEAEVHTGSRNRMYVARIYGPLVVKGGPMGWGSHRTDSFPPDIPGLPAEAASRERLGIVDNSYILLGLRFGWVGVGLFSLLLIVAMASAVSMRRTADTFLSPNGSLFVTSLACILFAISLEISTVFLQYDMTFWILFLVGIVAGLRAYAVRSMRGQEDLA